MSDQALREHVLYLLKSGGAHLNFDQAIADMPIDLRGAKVEGVSHTPWRRSHRAKFLRNLRHKYMRKRYHYQRRSFSSCIGPVRVVETRVARRDVPR